MSNDVNDSDIFSILTRNAVLRSFSQPASAISSPIPLPPIKIAIPRTMSETRLKKELQEIVGQDVNRVLARVLPAVGELPFTDAKEINAAVLYIDIRNSSSIAASHIGTVAAKIYRAFYTAAIYCGKHYGGIIGGFAGDRIMFVFPYKQSKNPQAIALKAALYMEHVMKNFVNPLLQAKFEHPLSWGVGIDFGEILIVRVGTRGVGNSDRIWVGDAANLASKLSEKYEGIYISKQAFEDISDNQLRLGPAKLYRDREENYLYYKYLGVFNDQ